MADYTSIFTGAEIDGRLAGVVADFDPGKTYYVGDFTFYENQVYRKTQNPGAGGFVAADWEVATVGSMGGELADIRTGADGHTYSTAGDAVRGQVSQISGAIDEISDNLDEFSGYNNYPLKTGEYYATNGATVNISNPSVNSGWKSIVVPCAEGDTFYVTGHSGSAPRLWCFVDASTSQTQATALTKAIASKTEVKGVITAPQNATHLVCNFDKNYDAELTKGETFTDAKNRIDVEIVNAIKTSKGLFDAYYDVAVDAICEFTIYDDSYEKYALNYLWVNSTSHTQYSLYISILGYKNGAFEPLLSNINRATEPANRPIIERLRSGNGLFELVIDWSKMPSTYTSAWNDSNRPIFDNHSITLALAEPKEEESVDIRNYELQDNIKHIIHVAEDGTGDYTTIADAYASIVDSSFENQYEIIIHDGTYNEQFLTPPPFTHTHGIKLGRAVIDSTGLPQLVIDGNTDWASVFQMVNTCKISNLTVISGTKYCIHEDSRKLSRQLIVCENLYLYQTKAHNNAIVGNGTQFGGTKYVFRNCTFVNGSFTTHSNTVMDAGANQHTMIDGCKFIDATITLSSVATNKTGLEGLYIFDCNNNTFDANEPIVLRFGRPISGYDDVNFPWSLSGANNKNLSVRFDNTADSRFTDFWDCVNTDDKTYVKATTPITKGQIIEGIGTALANGNTGDYVPVWRRHE